MTPFLQLSFWTGASMPCGKDGKRNDESEWRIYYPDDVLPASSLRQQILHIRSGWRFMVFFITTASLRHRSGWYLTVRRQKELWRTQRGWGYLIAMMTQIVKEYLACSWQLTADSFYLLTAFHSTVIDSSYSFRMTFYRPLSLRTGAEKESSFYSFASFPQVSILRPAPPATSL